MKNKYIFVFVLLSCILILSMGLTTAYVKQSEDKSQEVEDILIVTSFYPMFIAVENIVGDISGVTLTNLSEPQTGCLHDFQLTPEDMKLLSAADVFVINGGGIESFMEDVAKAYPNLTIVNACRDVSLLKEESERDGRNKEYENGGAHKNGEDHEIEEGHEHGEENAHAWMSVSSYRKQIASIEVQLEKKLPQYQEALEKNASIYDAKLVDLQKQQEELLQFTVPKPVILFHEAYAYVAKDYGLDVVFVMDLDEERQVSAGEVATVLNVIHEKKVSLILAEEMYGKDMGDMVKKEADVDVVYLDALNRGTYDSGSYIEGMQANIDLLKQALGR